MGWARCVARAPAIERARVLWIVLLSGVIAGCAVHPKRIDDDKNRARAADLLQRFTANQEPVTKPIDLYEAMARAVKYNLDYRVEMMEQALRVKDLDLKRMDMLPRLVASLDYSSRNNDSGGSSRSLLTGRTSLEPSTSSDRNVLATDMTLSWDVLDFGLSYVRAQQSADDVMIAEERKRKVLIRIIEDVRSAYWRSVSAERLLAKAGQLDRATQEALRSARAQVQGQQVAPLAPLTYQREVLLIKRETESLVREIAVAKQQLGALMNLPPDAQYTVVLPPRNQVWLPIAMSTPDMMRVAIENRPELREVAYQLRTNSRESTAALLRGLPNLKLFMGANWSDNSFLYNDRWLSAGARASWDVLNVFRLPADRQKVKAQDALLDQRSLALTTAVGVQVSVARARYEYLLRELDTATDMLQVQQLIMGQIQAGFQAEKLSRQTLLREQLNTVVSEVRYDTAVADLQNAFANLYSSIGVDPIDVSMSSHDSVDILAEKLRSLWRVRETQLTEARQ